MTKEWKLRARGGTIRRFVAPKIHLGEEVGLGADHPAVVEGRTLFPSTVVLPLESPGLFVSGQNNSKLGGRVMKGRLKDMPIYHLTLEERKTCPASCHVWKECYGNGMHMARRHDASDPFFLPLLRAQAAMLARTHPNGVLIRVHTLGDFFSVEYVEAWREILDDHLNLHVFGYTARDRTEDPIGVAIAQLAAERWDRFAIRFSGSTVRPQASITLPLPSTDPDVIMCPAQSTDDDPNKTDCCGTCGICWAEAAKDRCIGFLIHGRRLKGYNAHQKGSTQRRDLTVAQELLWKAMLAAADDNGVVRRGLEDLCDDAGIGVSARYAFLKSLINKQRLVRVLRKGDRGATTVYQVFTEKQDEFPPAPALPAPPRAARAKVHTDRFAVRSNIPNAVAPRPSRPPGEPPPMSRSSFRLSAYDGKGRLMRPWMIGTADQFEIGTAEQRLESVDEAERRRIAETYGATFKKAPAE